MLQTEQVLQERYQLQKQLGKNAGRQTWLAIDINASPPELVTVKLLAFSPQMQWEEFKLFEREASVLKQLNHPRIPQYRDYFSLDKQTGFGLCWFGLVQEYIPGYSLQELLNQGKRWKESEVRAIATQVLEIMIYLHGLNPPVLHRDIKPSNLILGEDNQVYLVDFGAVQNTAAVEGVTFTVVGTSGYAPLEQFWGKAVPASDLYALGATLIHLLTGTAPADLPQRNLRIQFTDQVSINPVFLSWIEALTEPDLNLRLSTAKVALESLQNKRYINYPLRPIKPPYRSKIKLHKSPSQLSITIPSQGLLLLRYFIVWLLKFSLNLSLGLSMLGLLLVLGILVIAILLYMVTSVKFPEFIAIALLLAPVSYVLWKIFQAGNKEFIKIGQDLAVSKIPALGKYSIKLDRNNFVIERRHLNILYFRKSGRTSNIKQVFSDKNCFAIFLLSGIKKHYLGKTSTQAECQWLIQEIQQWLAQR